MRNIIQCDLIPDGLANNTDNPVTEPSSLTHGPSNSLSAVRFGVQRTMAIKKLKSRGPARARSDSRASSEPS